MGSKYASADMQKKVKDCIRRLTPVTVVYPHALKREFPELKDHDQILGALQRIAPEPNVFVDIGGKSRLTRMYKPIARLGVFRSPKDNRWYYDPPGDEWLPIFPRLNEMIRIWTPRIHELLHPPVRDS